MHKITAGAQAFVFSASEPLDRVQWKEGGQLHLPCFTLTQRIQELVTFERQLPCVLEMMRSDTHFCWGSFSTTDIERAVVMNSSLHCNVCMCDSDHWWYVRVSNNSLVGQCIIRIGTTAYQTLLKRRRLWTRRQKEYSKWYLINLT